MLNSRKAQHITHCLNTSKTKATCSFLKAQRFQMAKSFSPNKFYDSASSISNRSSSIGFGKKTSFEKKHTISPDRYNIPSAFDFKATCETLQNTSTFGINRDAYYRAKQPKHIPGVGTYQIKDPINTKKFYMGIKAAQPINKHQLSSSSYKVTKEGYGKLSTYKNQGSYRMKTEYYPKHQLHRFDNKVPGPGSYGEKRAQSGSYRREKAFSSTFGVGERMRGSKTQRLGPGSYPIFSQFGKPIY